MTTPPSFACDTASTHSTEAPEPFRGVGVIVIGRDEGERLLRGLRSAIRSAERVVYVDSGSSDDSVAAARSIGVDVVELDPAVGFTAARARNAGLAALRPVAPGLPYVQFVDGDCELRQGWIEAGREFLDQHPEAAVVCGRRRERRPEASLWNRLCDREWDTPVGKAKACGGDALMRVEAVEAVGGWRDDLIAGEEPELCVRLRRAGWTVWRIDREMTWHDADMTRFAQWWRRAVRAGHAYAEGAALHGAAPERHWVYETRRALVWGGGLPTAIVAGTLLNPAALLLASVYPLQIVRLARREAFAREAWTVACLAVIARFAETFGATRYAIDRLRGRRHRLIEYKAGARRQP